MGSCRDTSIRSSFVSTIDCDGVRSCKDAMIVVDDPSNQFALECAGIESCFGLRIEINIPTNGQDCNDVIALSRITCESDKACEGLEIVLTNEGCNSIMIESVTCTQIGSCADAKFMIGNDIAINSFVCTTDACNNCLISDTAMNGGRACEEFTNGVQPNAIATSSSTQTPVVIVDVGLPSQVIGSLNPKPTPAPLSNSNSRYCCLTAIDNFDPWKGYCWGNDNEFYLSDAECCSNVCVFDTVSMQRGTCR